MRAVDVGGVVHEIDCNAFTPFIYSEEFMTTRKGKIVRDDINAAVSEVSEFLSVHSIPPMLKLLQLFWAFEKTANAKAPRFKSWLRGLPTDVLNLTQEEGWANAVMQEIEDNFFPKPASADLAPEAERAPATALA